MSFGFSIGDTIAVSTLANKVRKRFVGAPEQFKAIGDEVKSLSNVLRDLEDADLSPERDLTSHQQADLGDHMRGCGNILEELEGRLNKYDGLNDGRKLSKFGERTRRF